MKKRKPMTIDGLAEMTAKSFSGIHDSIAEVKSELKDMRHIMDRIEFRVNTYDRRLEIVEDKIRVIQTRVGLK